MRRVSALLQILFVLSAAISVASETPELITGAAVARRLSEGSIKIKVEQVRVLGLVSIRSEEAKLLVQKVESIRDRTSIVRIRCVRSADCIPFLVEIRWSDEAAMNVAVKHWIRSARRFHGAESSQRPDIRSGTKLALVMRGKQITATIPVVALDPGVIGSRIRVRALDNNLIYVATIEGDRTVEMEF